MFWLLTGAMLTYAQEEVPYKDIYVAPPTIHDESLDSFQPYLTSLLVSAAQANKHWVSRVREIDQVNIHNNHTVEVVRDTVCDYDLPLKCSAENLHWAIITDIFVTPNFATIVVKMYDEDTRLIASASKSSYSVEKCKDQTTVTTIKNGARPPTEITEKKPDKCTILNPRILAKDIKQAVSIMFASIHPE